MQLQNYIDLTSNIITLRTFSICDAYFCSWWAGMVPVSCVNVQEVSSYMYLTQFGNLAIWQSALDMAKWGIPSVGHGIVSCVNVQEVSSYLAKFGNLAIHQGALNMAKWWGGIGQVSCVNVRETSSYICIWPNLTIWLLDKMRGRWPSGVWTYEKALLIFGHIWKGALKWGIPCSGGKG